MTDRKLLDARRMAYHDVLRFTNGSGQTFRFLMSVGLFKDGSVAEAFLETHKAATDLQALASDAAIVFSVARQYGTPLQALREGMSRNSDGSPQSLLGALIDQAARMETELSIEMALEEKKS